MRYRAIRIFAIAQFAAIGLAAAQGCDMLLRDGVFNTFNKSGTRFAYDEWHQRWCSATVQGGSGSGTTGVGVNAMLGEIPLGLSYDDARSFQNDAFS